MGLKDGKFKFPPRTKSQVCFECYRLYDTVLRYDTIKKARSSVGSSSATIFVEVEGEESGSTAAVGGGTCVEVYTCIYIRNTCL